MAAYYRILAWRIPRTEEPGGLAVQVAKSQTGLKRRSTHAWREAGRNGEGRGRFSICSVVEVFAMGAAPASGFFLLFLGCSYRAFSGMYGSSIFRGLTSPWLPEHIPSVLRP